jgi:hypothetical protein
MKSFPLNGSLGSLPQRRRRHLQHRVADEAAERGVQGHADKKARPPGLSGGRY